MQRFGSSSDAPACAHGTFVSCAISFHTLRVNGLRVPPSLGLTMALPPPPPPPPQNGPGGPGQDEGGGHPDHIPETHNFGGTRSSVVRRWKQQFARDFPEVDRDRKLVMKAARMPYARWMFYKTEWTCGWGWGCDLCQMELTEDHITSRKHNTATRNRYQIPNCHVDFAGPSFVNGKPVPAAPGGVPRAVSPKGWETYQEMLVLPPDWNHIPYGWPAENAPEDFQTPAGVTPSEAHMLPPAAAGHLGRPDPIFLPVPSNLAAPSRRPPEAGGASSRDPWRRPTAASGQTEGSRATTIERIGDRATWSNWGPGGAPQGEAGGRGRSQDDADASTTRAGSATGSQGTLLALPRTHRRGASRTTVKHNGRTRPSGP